MHSPHQEVVFKHHPHWSVLVQQMLMIMTFKVLVLHQLHNHNSSDGGADSVSGHNWCIYFDGVEKPASYQIERGMTFIFDQSDNSNEYMRSESSINV